MFKCTDCVDKFKELEDLYEHIEEDHESKIPSEYTVPQYYYYRKTGKVCGRCVICKKPTEWNKSTNKYHRFCKNPKCKNEYREEFKKRMIKSHGKIHLLNDPEHQKKMLANRKISGTYIWSDGTEFTYTGSYELDFLKFLDLTMGFESSDVLFPSPHVYTYTYEGEEKFYMPDGFIMSLNTEIEIKESDNTHPKIQAVDKVKEKLKDDVLTSQKSFNYIKLVDKNNIDFLKFLDKLKIEFEKNPKKPRLVFQINDKVSYGEGVQESVVTESYNTEVFNQRCIESVLSGQDMISILTESEDLTILDKNFKPKGYLDLDSFKKNNLTDALAKKYGIYIFAKSLKRHRGYVYTDKNDDSLVAMIAVATYKNKESWIQPIQVSEKYRGYGLSNQLMNIAINKLGAKYLAVYSDNEVAIQLYKKYGFKVFEKVDYNNEIVYFMSIDSPQRVKYLKENYNDDLLPDLIVNESCTTEVYTRMLTESVVGEFCRPNKYSIGEDTRYYGKKIKSITAIEDIEKGEVIDDVDSELGSSIFGPSRDGWNVDLIGNKFIATEKISKGSTLWCKVNCCTESSSNYSKGDKHPIFVVLTYTGSVMAKAIRGVTREAYSHASISFDTSMTKLYSFGQQLGGFVQESFQKGYFKKVEDRCTYGIYVTFVTKEQKEAMQKFADSIAAMKDQFKFNMVGLFTLMMGKESNRSNEYFCSQFVAEVLSKGTDIIKRDPSLYAPMDLVRNKSFKFLCKGTLKDYDKSKVDKIIKDKFNK